MCMARTRSSVSAGARRASAADEVWQPDALRLFISHISAHKKAVSEIRDVLRPHGVSAFVAHTDINPTRAWQDVIETALETCHAMLAYLTPGFKQSNWTEQEIGYSVARRVLIIPVRVSLNPYGFIAKYQALNGEGKTPVQLAADVLDVLISHELTASRMAVPTIKAFVDSFSYDNARTNLARLQKVHPSAWTPDLVASVRAALSENSQLRDGVESRARPLGPRPIPEAVEELLAGA